MCGRSRGGRRGWTRGFGGCVRDCRASGAGLGQVLRQARRIRPVLEPAAGRAAVTDRDEIGLLDAAVERVGAAWLELAARRHPEWVGYHTLDDGEGLALRPCLLYTSP